MKAAIRLIKAVMYDSNHESFYQAVFDCDTLGQRIVKSKCSSMDGTTYAPLEATNSEQSLSPDWM
jgi:hypothetical protein